MNRREVPIHVIPAKAGIQSFSESILFTIIPLDSRLMIAGMTTFRPLALLSQNGRQRKCLVRRFCWRRLSGSIYWAAAVS